MVNKRNTIGRGLGSLLKTKDNAIDKKIFDEINLKFIEQEELNILYNTAFCLIYPSLQEGFGLPVVEAQTAGCPVIAVNASSIPEISNHAAILMENGSIEEIRHSISELNIGEKKMKLVEDGLKNSKKYKWDVIMNDYIKLYKRYM